MVPVRKVEFEVSNRQSDVQKCLAFTGNNRRNVMAKKAGLLLRMTTLCLWWIKTIPQELAFWVLGRTPRTTPLRTL
jgi:hypothetical protein